MGSGTESETPGFRTKVLNSVKLSTLKFASEIGVRLISTVVLTRLLAPEIYGVFAIVLVYLYLLEMFSDLGIRSLILTKEGEVDDDFLRTCWSVAILRGVLILAVSALIGIVIATLQAQGVFAADNPYASEALPLAIAALGATSLITSFQSPMRFMSEREMAFGRVTFVDVTRSLVVLAVTIVLAYQLRSIWALVLGNVVGACLLVTLSFLVFRGPAMRFTLHRDHLHLLIDRGKWIIGHSALTAVSQSADRLVLGFVMSSSTFGFYFIARQIVDLVVQFLETINGQMGLQVFTHIQRSTTEKFRYNYYRYRLFFDAVAGLSTGGMVVLAPLLVDIVFDDRYRDVAPIIQVLILAALLAGPLLLRSAYSAQRRFKEMTLMSILSTAVLLVGLLAGVFIFDSILISLIAIALHRVPEAATLTALGRFRGWVSFRLESRVLIFFAVGALIGWGLLSLTELIL